MAALRVVLVAEAVGLLCALPAVLMPTAWMATVHEALGMGEMPRGPLVEYLTRSLSLLYALVAPVLLALATDVRRFLPLIRVVGWLHVFGAAALTGIGLFSGLPWWWAALEGPVVLAFGVALLVISDRSDTPSESV